MEENLGAPDVAEMDIDTVCKKCSEDENSPQVFLLSDRIAGSLLGVSTSFLEEGQLLQCPSLPLAGAAFDPNWGFSQAVVGTDAIGRTKFQLPEVHHRFLNSGDTHGYRLCVIENTEIPEVIAQLENIRSALALRGSKELRDLRLGPLLLRL
jgi:hypothetical protein